MSEIECIQVFWIHYGQIFRIQVIKYLHSNCGKNWYTLDDISLDQYIDICARLYKKEDLI